MPLESLDIRVAVDRPRYFGGDTVTGYVEVPREQNISQVRLVFEAKEEYRRQSLRQKIVYDRQEVPVRNDSQDIGALLEEFLYDERVVQPTRKYLFSFFLPRGLPSTVHEGDRAEITYVLKAFRKDRPEVASFLEFEVGGSYTEALLEKLEACTKAEKKRTVLGLASIGHITLRAVLARQYVYAGEPLEAIICVENQTRRSLISVPKAIVVQLRKYVEFRHFSPLRPAHIGEPDSKIVRLASRYTALLDLKVDAGDTQTRRCRFLVPSNVPSTVSPCQVLVSKNRQYHDTRDVRKIQAGVVVNIYWQIKVRLNLPFARHISVRIPVVLLHRNPHPQLEPSIFIKFIKMRLPDYGKSVEPEQRALFRRAKSPDNDNGDAEDDDFNDNAFSFDDGVLIDESKPIPLTENFTPSGKDVEVARSSDRSKDQQDDIEASELEFVDDRQVSHGEEEEEPSTTRQQQQAAAWWDLPPSNEEPRGTKKNVWQSYSSTSSTSTTTSTNSTSVYDLGETEHDANDEFDFFDDPRSNTSSSSNSSRSSATTSGSSNRSTSNRRQPQSYHHGIGRSTPTTTANGPLPPRYRPIARKTAAPTVYSEVL